MAAPKKRRNPVINMDRENTDLHYRYKFEKVSITAGKHKKTIIKNIVQIADGILGTKMSTNNNKPKHTEPYNKDIIHKTAKHLIRFIQKRLGSQCQFKKGTKVAIISGVYSPDQIQTVIFDYVDAHAMCPQCHDPELTPAIHSPVQCKACGYHCTTKDHKPRKKKKRKGKEKAKKGNEVHATQEEKDPISALNAYLSQNETLSTGDLMEKIKILRIAHDLDRRKEIEMIVSVLMKYEEDNYQSLMASLKKYRNVFEIYAMTRTDCLIFVSYLEEVIMCKSIGNNLLNHAYHIFNCLYDEDILDEDEIKEWYHSKHNEYRIVSADEVNSIKQKAKPFVEWLENADNEDSDD
eukprot:182916_1